VTVTDETPPPSSGSSPAPLLPHIERILDAARIAPSRDNLQPWRFIVEDETVSFGVDHERDRSPANADGRMARIAVGAAIECALLRAGRMGTIVKMQLPRGGALATITFSSPKRIPEPDKALLRRVTNRHLYDARPVDDATFAWLREATPPLESSRTLWFGRERVRTLGPIVEEAETLFFGDQKSRDAALQAVRFDVRDREEVTHGLSLGCMELSAPERVTFDTLRRTPPERLAAMGVFTKTGARVRRLIESASGVCVISASGVDAASDLAVGRSMQRAWLALTRRGLVAHPMSSLAALEAMQEHDARGGTPNAQADRIAAVVAAARAAFPNLEKGARIGLLIRFGWAPAPSTRVRRLALEDSVATGREA
jgi:nitroreductase